MKPACTLLLSILFIVISSGCSPSVESQPPTASTTPTPTTSVQQATVTQEDVSDARQVVYDYWDAFNSYDVERVLGYLQDSYRQESEESIKSEISKMKFFNVKLGVEEESEPVITPEGMVEIKMKLSTPIGAKHVTYILEKLNGGWKICSSVEE